MAFLIPGVPVHLQAVRPSAVLPPDADLSSRLRFRRRELGQTQRQAAVVLGVNDCTILGWERGQQEPHVSHYPAIIGYLGYEPWPVPQTLGQALRAERCRRGWTLQAVASFFGVEEHAVPHWERDERRPPPRFDSRIREFLG